MEGGDATGENDLEYAPALQEAGAGVRWEQDLALFALNRGIVALALGTVQRGQFP